MKKLKLAINIEHKHESNDKTIKCPNANVGALFPDHNQYDKNSNWKATGDKCGFKVSRGCELWHEAGLIAAKDDIADYYLNGLKTLNEPVKFVDPEWNDWLAENQHLVGPMGLSRN